MSSQKANHRHPQWDASAAPDGGVPPFARHHAMAQELFRTFQEALEPQIVAKGRISREEFARAFDLMTGNWPRTLPLFARTCRGCTDGPETLGPELPDFGDDRRQDFVTRLLFSSVSRQVAESKDPLTGNVFPRIILPGLQANLTALFYDREWEAMNADARSILSLIRPGNDEEIWSRVAGHPTLPVLSCALFVRIMLRFKQFHLQRQAFMRRMTGIIDPQSFTFTDEHFEQIFEALFGHLRGEISSELGRARMDVRYGDETSAHLLRIFDAFDALRRQRAQPIRSLGGGVRTSGGGALRAPGSQRRRHAELGTR